MGDLIVRRSFSVLAVLAVLCGAVSLPGVRTADAASHALASKHKQKACKKNQHRVHGKCVRKKHKKSSGPPAPPAATATPVTLGVPSGVAIDGQGNVFVTDSGGDRVVEFASDGSRRGAFGTFGSDPGQFEAPWGIAVDAQNNLYVTEVGNIVVGSGNARVQKLSASGTPMLQIGSRGDAPGQFQMPTDVTVEGSGNILVTDHLNNVVQRFSPAGQLLDRFPVEGPAGIALDTAGNIYIAQYDAGDIVKLSPAGALLATFSSPGSDPGQLHFPDGLGVDAQGNMYVVDAGNNRVEKFSPTGAFLAAWGKRGSDPGQFDFRLNMLDGLRVDTQGNVYVVDVDNARVQKLSSTGTVLAIFR